MNAKQIVKGQTLELKRDNPYGFTDLLVTVEELRYRSGYLTPWIIDPQGRAFRPRDFKRAV